MKKVFVILLSLALMMSLSACGGDSGGQSPAPSGAPSGETEKQEAKVYGIGETAEANDLAITIDKVESPDPNIFLNPVQEGFTYMQVYCTIKNLSDETIDTPQDNCLYIVYEDGLTADDRDMKAHDDSNIIPGNKESMYRSFTELAPGESVSGWMMYQRPVDMQEVTMHYYNRFLSNVPDIVFRFTVE